MEPENRKNALTRRRSSFPRRASRILTGVVTAVALWGGFGNGSASARDAGRDLLDAGKTTEAVAYYHDRLSRNADDVEAMAGLGEAYLAGGDFDQAIESMERGLELDEANFDLALNLALAYYYKAKDLADRGRPSTVVGSLLLDARKCVDKAVEWDRNRFEGFQTLGVITQFQLEFDVSAKALRRSLEIRPDDAYTWYQLGETLRFSENYSEAAEAYERAVEFFPRYYAAYRMQGLCHQLLEDREKAADCYRGAILSSPGEMGAWDDLWNLYSARGDFEAAVGVYQSLARDLPSSSYVHLVLGSVYAYAKNSRDAIAEFEKVSEMSTDVDTRSAALYQIGLSHIELGSFRKAKGFLRDALTLVPSFQEPVTALSDLSRSLRSGGDFDESIEILEHLTYLRKENSGLWAQLAGAYRDSGKPREARDAFERSLALEPYEPQVLTDFGSLLDRELGRTDDAIKLWITAVEIEDQVDAMENLARVYLGCGWDREAAAMAKRGLAFEPNRFSLRGLLADAESRIGR